MQKLSEFVEQDSVKSAINLYKLISDDSITHMNIVTCVCFSADIQRTAYC